MNVGAVYNSGLRFRHAHRASLYGNLHFGNDNLSGTFGALDWHLFPSIVIMRFGLLKGKYMGINHKIKSSVSGLDLPAGLNQEDLVDVYGTMVLVRALDERVWALNRQGKAALVASCQGHEAAQLGSVWAMRNNSEEQFYFTYYRDMAVFLGVGMSPQEIMLGYMAKEGEPLSGARQFPLHGADMNRKIMNLSNVVAAHVTEAVGWALACKLRKIPTVVATYFGDGASSQGDVHEAMNFASIHQLPIVFLCENNKYAISVPLSSQMAIPSLVFRASGYGMPGVIVDGTDLFAVYRSTSEAVKRAAQGDGPSLVEFDVDRYLPHTSDDDDSVYRSHEEILAARERDPLLKLRALLFSSGLIDEKGDSLVQQRAKGIVNEATEFAEAAPYPTPEDLFDHLYGQGKG
jgi:2-oxoisovalerate dehydrogenase E1 component alpha subunit